MLKSLIHGAALTELLIEGHNPYARQKLNTETADALRQHIHAPDTLLAYVCGREVLAGAGVFALTQEKFLAYHAATGTVSTVAINQIGQAQAVRGKYGHTVRIHTEARTYAMYGVDKSLAGAMHQALLARGIASTFEDKSPRGTLWSAYSGPHPSVDDCLLDARQRLLAA
jgi:hypothetical protein